MMMKLRKHLEMAGCTSKTWKCLINCNLPKKKGYVPLLEKAMSKNIIPLAVASEYFSQIKQQEEEIRARGFSPLYLAFCGDVGNYKTLMAVRYMVIKAVQEDLICLFLTNDELVGLLNGSLEIHYYVDDITFAVETQIKPARSQDGYSERLPFTSIMRFYDIVLIDDLEENGITAFEKLILQAYDAEGFLITTTNIAPPSRLLSLLSEKARSRLLERGIAVHVTGIDKRTGGAK
ncbi:hypothetical protein [Desulfurobacterium sp.]